MGRAAAAFDGGGRVREAGAGADAAAVEIGEGTHLLMLERNRLQLFHEVQLFLDEPRADGGLTPRRQDCGAKPKQCSKRRA